MNLPGRPARLLLACAGLLAACALYLAEPALLQALRNNLFDQFQRWQPRPAPAETHVLVVDIDESSLARLGQWPWPRDRMAQLLDRLRQAGAVIVSTEMVVFEWLQACTHPRFKPVLGLVKTKIE